MLIMSILLFIIWTILALFGERCPDDILPVTSLNLDDYKGTWYEMYRVEGAVGQIGECGTVFYTYEQGSHQIDVRNVQLLDTFPN